MATELLTALLEKTSEIEKLTIESSQHIEKVRKAASASSASNFYPGGVGIVFTEEQLEANKAAGELKVKEIEQQREAAIQEIIDSGEALISAAEDKAAQEVADTEPMPTEKDLARMEQIKKDHAKMTFEDKADIAKKLRYEASHGTSAAPAYYFLAHDTLDMTEENIQLLGEAYRNIFKDSMKAQEALEQVGSDSNAFRASVLINKFNRLGNSMSFEERIAIKNRLAFYGYINLLAQ